MQTSFSGYQPAPVVEQSPVIQRHREFMALRPGDNVYVLIRGMFGMAPVVDFPRLTREGAVVKTTVGLVPQHRLLLPSELV